MSIKALKALFGGTESNAKKDLQKEERRTLSSLDANFDPAQCTVHDFPDPIRCWTGRRKQFAVVIENLLSPEECERWISDTETHDYELALVNIGGGAQRAMTDVRNSSRCIIDDEDRARELWARARHFVPADYSTWQPRRPVELNERLRFLRYDPGEYFAQHCDGSYAHPPGHPKCGEASELTFFLYLNDGYQGGTTRFFSANPGRRCEIYDVPIKAGSVVIFEHRMSHSGEIVTRGRKYALRTDVMFAHPAAQSEAQEGKEWSESELA